MPSLGDHPERISGRPLETALSASSEMGPYFGIHSGAGPATLRPQQLYEPERMQSLLSAVGRRIGTGEGRVAASTLQYGLAARCWSLVLGTWRCGGLVLDLRGVGYVVTAVDSVELTLIDMAAWDHTSAPTDHTAERIVNTVVALLDGLHAALHAVARVADGLFWGNAASSLISAAQTVAAEHPGAEISALTTSILYRRPLVDRLVDAPAGGFRRLSCCLWYRTAEKSHCGDCPVAPRI